MNVGKLFILCVALVVSGVAAAGSAPPVTVQQGVMQWAPGSAHSGEVVLFGANYNVPFAYGYRALNKLGVDHKAAIDMDVDHMARLKLDAYRIHMWDRLISDKQGNLLDNEHLELLDYLLMRLQQHGIKAIITPIAWWGSGYPEPDPVESGFSADYSKAEMNQVPSAIAAQKRYLTQLMQHVNRFTGRTLRDDPDIIAFELFNEPKHTQNGQASAEYVESLIATLRTAGVTKPLFYNISEQGANTDYASALCAGSIDGVSYQWYPTGLLKYSAFQNNMLPAVAAYPQPFRDIEACNSKAKIVYEFDAADVSSSVMYPAMARSFRSAGFQWASVFEYEPAAIAHTNSEYNTHFLNLLYTPSKAISLMIAGEVFRQLPRGYEAAPYPQSNEFGNASVDYAHNLSILNDGTQFYYSNTTGSAPKQPKQLQHIAGVGRSAVVEYAGSGAYFLDKQQSGEWRLEVYPDVIELQDPYQSSSLKREVARLYLQRRAMTVNLADLGTSFYVQRVDKQDQPRQQAKAGRMDLQPGVYLLSRNTTARAITDTAYYLPAIPAAQLALVHQPQRVRTVGDTLTFSAQVQGMADGGEVVLSVRYLGHQNPVILPMHSDNGIDFSVTLPHTSQWQQPGVLDYQIVVSDTHGQVTFPGAAPGQPSDWDFVSKGSWTMQVNAAGAPLFLLDPASDRGALLTPKAEAAWPATSATEDGPIWKLAYYQQDLRAAGSLLRATLAKDNSLEGVNMQRFRGIAVRVRSLGKSDRLQLGLIGQDGLAWGTDFSISPQWETKVIPLSALKPIATILPRAYPMFTPATFGPLDSQGALELAQIEGMQLLLPDAPNARDWKARGIELADVALVEY